MSTASPASKLVKTFPLTSLQLVNLISNAVSPPVSPGAFKVCVLILGRSTEKEPPVPLVVIVHVEGSIEPVNEIVPSDAAAWRDMTISVAAIAVEKREIKRCIFI
jgi:hypothetical protein